MLYENIIIQAQAVVEDQHRTLDQDTNQDHDLHHIISNVELCVCNRHLSMKYRDLYLNMCLHHVHEN